MASPAPDDIRGALAVAEEALREAGVLRDGWGLNPRVTVGPEGLELRLHHGEGPGLGIQWRMNQDGVRAFCRGGLYAASYRRGPGLWDVDDQDTPEEIRQRAHRACRSLTALGAGPDLETLTPPVAPEAPFPGEALSTDDLARALGEMVAGALKEGRSPEAPGWSVREVGVFERWAPVAEVRLGCEERTLCFIAHERDPERPGFVGGARFDLTYYSDDLTPEEHGDLYERDRALIDTVAALFVAWDRR